MLLRVQVQIHVDADPDRVTAATVSSSAPQATDDGEAFAPVHGYTTDSLLKDTRFKVTPEYCNICICAKVRLALWPEMQS